VGSARGYFREDSASKAEPENGADKTDAEMKWFGRGVLTSIVLSTASTDRVPKKKVPQGLTEFIEQILAAYLFLIFQSRLIRNTDYSLRTRSTGMSKVGVCLMRYCGRDVGIEFTATRAAMLVSEHPML
jgi:hypothetical protein